MRQGSESQSYMDLGPIRLKRWVPDPTMTVPPSDLVLLGFWGGDRRT